MSMTIEQKKNLDEIKAKSKKIAENFTKNAPVDSEVIDEANVTLNEEDHSIRRYKTGHIRAFKGEVIQRNTKAVLRQVNIEFNFGYDEEFFKKKETRTIGKLFIEKINSEKN